MEFEAIMPLYFADIAHESELFMRSLDTYILAENYIACREGTEVVYEEVHSGLIQRFLDFIKKIKERIKELFKRVKAYILKSIRGYNTKEEHYKEMADMGMKVRLVGPDPIVLDYNNITAEPEAIFDQIQSIATKSLDKAKKIGHTNQDQNDGLFNFMNKDELSYSKAIRERIDKFNNLVNDRNEFSEREYSVKDGYEAYKTINQVADKIDKLYNNTMKMLQDLQKSAEEIKNNYTGYHDGSDHLNSIIKQTTMLISQSERLLGICCAWNGVVIKLIRSIYAAAAKNFKKKDSTKDMEDKT